MLTDAAIYARVCAAGNKIEATRFVVREHCCDAPTEAVITGAPRRRRVGQRDEIHGSGWPSSCSIATFVIARFSVSLSFVSIYSLRTKHSASILILLVKIRQAF